MDVLVVPDWKDATPFILRDVVASTNPTGDFMLNASQVETVMEEWQGHEADPETRREWSTFLNGCVFALYDGGELTAGVWLHTGAGLFWWGAAPVNWFFMPIEIIVAKFEEF